MDYRTFFLTNIVSVTVFTICVCLLAWFNRSITGMKWFAGGLLVGLVKLILQGCEGHLPSFLTGMLELELYLIAFLMQMLGLHWFVLRKPPHYKWPLAALVLALVSYTTMFVIRLPYSNNVINIPCIVVCAASAWMVLKHGRGPFAAVSRAAGVILLGELAVVTYRAVLTNLRYARPWEQVHAQTDPRWVYSLDAMAFLATCMVMCDLWYLVAELNSELAEQARTDSLTGALNRRAMEEAAARETARSIRYGQQLCLIMLDIDHFKQLNDSRGHAAGDCVLQMLVRQIKAMLRIHDLLARTGGEEFTILLPSTSPSAGVIIAERVRQALEELEVPFEDEILHFTVSAGVALLDPSQGGWENLMRRADSAMYTAKAQGRNLVAVPQEQIETALPQPEAVVASA